jgi:hypothetical protein
MLLLTQDCCHLINRACGVNSGEGRGLNFRDGTSGWGMVVEAIGVPNRVDIVCHIICTHVRALKSLRLRTNSGNCRA